MNERGRETYPENQTKVCEALPIPIATNKIMKEPKVKITLAHKKNHVPANQSFAKCRTTHICGPKQ
jgi:hypothetical protein